jgi:GDP-4-dehydro-6-deoxy-D-mannose reductase
MRILITGITGFVGSHLAEYVLMLGHDVFGTTRPRSNLENLEECKNKINLMDCNILDYLSVSHVIKEVSPDIIFHLAAQTFVPTS